ncbi:MAG: hypothetical protein AAGD96_17285 [Chloroflexota bacterium]
MNNKQSHSNNFESKKHEKLYKELSRQALAGSYSPTADDFDLIDFYAAEAYNGIEIDQSYPDFYSKLMRSRPLSDAFVKQLRSIENSPESIAAPGSSSFNLDFLHEQGPLSVYAETLKDWWTLGIEVSRKHLNELFDALNNPFGDLRPSFAMRSGAELQVDPKTVQLIDEIVNDIPELTLHVSLEGTIFFDNSTLNCELLVTEVEDNPLPSDLLVDLHWGSVHLQKEIDPEVGLVNFDGIPIQEIASVESEIKYGLHLEIIQNPLKSGLDGEPN